MPDRVRERFAERRHELFADAASGVAASIGPLNVTRGSKPSARAASRAVLSTSSRSVVVAQPSRVETEDRRPDVANRSVDLVDCRFDACRGLLVRDVGERALQRQPDREQTLNHRVVQIAGNALAVVDEGKLLVRTHQFVRCGAAFGHVADDRHDMSASLVFDRAQADLDRKFLARLAATVQLEARSHRACARMLRVPAAVRRVRGSQRVGRQDVDAGTDQLVRVVPEELPHRCVREFDTAGVVDDGDPVGRGVDRAPQQLIREIEVVPTRANGSRIGGCFHRLGTRETATYPLKSCREDASMESNLLLPASPHRSLDDYLAAGGGQALAAARERGATGCSTSSSARACAAAAAPAFPPAASGDRLRPAVPSSATATSSPTAPKASRARSRTGRCCARTRTRCSRAWRSPRPSSARARRSVAVKASFAPEIDALERALREMADADLLGDAPVTSDRRTRGVPVRRGEGAARGHRGQRPDAALAAAVPARPVRDDAAGRMVGRLRAVDADDDARVGSNPTLVIERRDARATCR